MRKKTMCFCRNLALIALALMAWAMFFALPTRAAAETDKTTEFRLLRLPSHAGAIAAGPDGSMWFAASYAEPRRLPSEWHWEYEIDRISVGGQISRISDAQQPRSFTRGPDGNLWFTNELGVGGIAKVTASGKVTDFPLSRTNPGALTSGPDGNLWFTAVHWSPVEGGPPNKVEVIGRMTPSGKVTEFPLSGTELYPTEITAGPDGNIWFTESFGNKIGRITPSGDITEFPLPTEGSHPVGITTGTDGNLWFTEERANPPAIGRITPSGQITEFPFPSKEGYPGQIVQGADGRLWFDYGLGMIGKTTLSGRITKIDLPHKTEVNGIALGPEGNIWYTAQGEGPCLGGGGTCMVRIPTEPAIVGTITPGPLAVAVRGKRAPVPHRWARVRLACVGGEADSTCRGRVRLSRRLRNGAANRRHRVAMKKNVTLAATRYMLAADEERWIAVRLRRRALKLLGRRGRLRVTVTATAREGERASRSIMLRPRARPRHHRHRPVGRTVNGD